MKNEKEYYNKDLEKILKKYITREKYGNFDLIIEDIFQRRAYEFDFPLNQMEQEVENFVRNVNLIKFVSKEEMFSVNSMGVYSSGNSEIRINQDYYNDLLKKTNENEFGSALYEVLTHEIYHAISDYNKLGYMGVAYWDGQEWKGNALNEICVETAADRATFTKTSEDAQRYRRETLGYSDITFFSNFFAASLGVTEKEFLRAGVQNRSELIDLFGSQFPNDEIASFAQERLFKSIETNLDVIYNLNYKSDDSLNNKDMKNAMFKSSLTALYNKSYELAGFQIATNTDKSLKESTADATYRFLKMEKIMKDSLDLFEKYGIINKEDKKNIEKNTYDARNSMATKVNALNNLNRQKYKIKDENILQEQFENAKRGFFYRTSNIKMLKENYGVDLEYKNIAQLNEDTKDLEYSKYILKEDYDNGMQWDNVSASIVMKKIFEEHMKEIWKKSEEITAEIPIITDDMLEPTEEIPIITDDMLEKKNEGFFSKIKNGLKNIFTKFQNRNLKQLEAPSIIIEKGEENNNNNISRKSSDYFSQYRVDPNSINHEVKIEKTGNDKDNEINFD